MKPARSINHIGIAVNSIEASRKFYEVTLGATFEGCETIEQDQVRIAFFRIGDVRLELLEPVGPDSVLTKHLKTRGEGLHHIALQVDGIHQRVEELKTDGITMIDTVPRVGSRGNAIAFIHPKSASGVLLELCEERNED